MKRLPGEREGSFVETVVPSEPSPRRLDQYLAETDLPVTRSRIQRWIREGAVSVNAVVVRKSGHKVSDGDIVTVVVPAPPPSNIVPESIPLDIVYEDEALLVVNKAAGMVVHPACGHTRSTLVNALLHHCEHLKQFEDPVRPGIVHRLDKETSGLIIVAKREDAHAFLSRQLAERHIKRGYTGLVWGCPPEASGSIDAPIGRHPRHRQRMAVVEAGSGRRAGDPFPCERRNGGRDVTVPGAGNRAYPSDPGSPGPYRSSHHRRPPLRRQGQVAGAYCAPAASRIENDAGCPAAAGAACIQSGVYPSLLGTDSHVQGIRAR